MIIYVKHNDRQALKEFFGCSDALVSKALNFKDNSLLSRRIRVHAVNKLGGILLTEE